MAEVEHAAATAPWRVKYAGDCMYCGRRLQVGVPAAYDARARRIHCIGCPRPGQDQIELPPERGIAGAAALREYERQVAERQARTRRKWGDRLGNPANCRIPQPVHAWKVGAEGEQKVGALLDSLVGCRVLHDRRLTGGEGNIDHVVVSAAGVFVVETKHWAGRIMLKVRGSFRKPDSRLWVGRYDRTSRVVRALAQADAVRHALADAGSPPPPPVTQVACFVDSGVAQLDAPREFRGVQLVTTLTSLRGLITRAPVIAGPEEVDAWHRLLAAAFPPMLGSREMNVQR